MLTLLALINVTRITLLAPPSLLLLLTLLTQLPLRPLPPGSVPESVLADGGALTSAAFDGHLSQLLYVSTAAAETLIFNTRVRSAYCYDDDDDDDDDDYLSSSTRGCDQLIVMMMTIIISHLQYEGAISLLFSSSFIFNTWVRQVEGIIVQESRGMGHTSRSPGPIYQRVPFPYQARAIVDPDEPPSKTRPVPECRWLDTLATDGPFSTEPLLALTTTKGFLFSAGLGHLTTRNVSTIYYQVRRRHHHTSDATLSNATTTTTTTTNIATNPSTLLLLLLILMLLSPHPATRRRRCPRPSYTRSRSPTRCPSRATCRRRPR